MFAQLEAAAGTDTEATEMLAEHDRLRHQTQSRLARSLHRRKRLKPGLGPRRAADVIWTLASERTYLALVRDRGWKAADYERWLTDQLVAALLPHTPPRSKLESSPRTGADSSRPPGGCDVRMLDAGDWAHSRPIRTTRAPVACWATKRSRHEGYIGSSARRLYFTGPTGQCIERSDPMAGWWALRSQAGHRRKAFQAAAWKERLRADDAPGVRRSRGGLLRRPGSPVPRGR